MKALAETAQLCGRGAAARQQLSKILAAPPKDIPPDAEILKQIRMLVDSIKD